MRRNAMGRILETNEKIRAIGSEIQVGDMGHDLSIDTNLPFTQKVEILEGKRKGEIIDIDVKKIIED